MEAAIAKLSKRFTVGVVGGERTDPILASLDFSRLLLLSSWSREAAAEPLRLLGEPFATDRFGASDISAVVCIELDSIVNVYR